MTGRAPTTRKPELIAALKMMQQQHYDAAADDRRPGRARSARRSSRRRRSSPTPSTATATAVIDLWHSTADALASTANVLADAGWQRGNVWGYEVALPRDFAYELADPDQAKPIAEWKKLGVRTIAGTALPASEEPGAVFLPAGARGPAFMVFDNFKVILKYNNATSYALAVCLLADRIRGLVPSSRPGRATSRPLSRDERVAFQTYLTKLGYDIGNIDGVLGRKARSATAAVAEGACAPRRRLPDRGPSHPHRGGSAGEEFPLKLQFANRAGAP